MFVGRYTTMALWCIISYKTASGSSVTSSGERALKDSIDHHSSSPQPSLQRYAPTTGFHQQVNGIPSMVATNTETMEINDNCG